MRSGKVLNLKSFGDFGVMSPVRACKGGTFKVPPRGASAYSANPSVEASSERAHRVLMEEYGLRRCLLAVDSKGRSIVAEKNELSFFCASSAVNVGSFASPSWTRPELERPALGVVGKHISQFKVRKSRRAKRRVEQADSFSSFTLLSPLTRSLRSPLVADQRDQAQFCQRALLARLGHQPAELQIAS